MAARHNGDLPPGWVRTTLGEVAAVSTGTTPSKKNTANYGESLPFVKPPELRDGPIRSAADGLSAAGARLARVLPQESVLVSCIGRLGLTGINMVPVAFNQQINAAVFPDGIVPRYGFYYSQTLRNWLYSVASATTLPIVNKTRFSEAEFPLPPTNEQRRIVARIEELFSKLDAGVAELVKAKAQLKRYRQAVLKAAFSGELTAEWRRQRANSHEPIETAKELLERIRKARANSQVGKGQRKYKEPPPLDTSGLPELPEGWAWARLDSVAGSMLGKMLDRAKHTKGSQLPYLRNVNVRWGAVDTGDLKTMYFRDEELQRYELMKGDVLVCEGGEPGRAAVWDGRSSQMKYQKALHRVRTWEGIDPKWLVLQLQLDARLGRLETYFTGSTIKHFTGVGLNRYAVRVASSGEQLAVVAEVERQLSVVDAESRSVEAALKRAARLRQSILKRAFEGKLVPQDPNDEPAEKLLERIKAEKAKSQVAKGRKAGAKRRAARRPNGQ